MYDVAWLLMGPYASTSQALGTAQLALRRSWYLSRQMQEVCRSHPEAAAMLSRSAIETALVGAYLAIKGDDAIRRFTKKQASASRRLQQRFTAGDTLGALKLIAELDFVAESLDSSLDQVDKLPNVIDVCRELDKHPPFDKYRLASLLYEEAYSIYSNHVEHPTPQSLRRHADVSRFAIVRRTHMFTPKKLVPTGTLAYSTWPAVGALCAVIARKVGRKHSNFDAWANDVAEVDGYTWSASPARVLAAEGLADLCGIRSVRLLNRMGTAIRLLEIMGVFEECQSPAEQLLVASQTFDDMKDVSPTADRVLPLLYPSRLIRLPSRQPGMITSRIANGEAKSNPQALLAALALSYCGAWPDNPIQVDQMLEDIDNSSPHAYVLADDLMRRRAQKVDLTTMRKMHRYTRPRWRNQVNKLQ